MEKKKTKFFGINLWNYQKISDQAAIVRLRKTLFVNLRKIKLLFHFILLD